MGSTGSSTNSADKKEFIEKETTSHQVVIFSKSYCPYCKATKATFTSKYPGADVKVYELDNMGAEGSAIQNTLLSMTGQRTVPNVFVNGAHLGGNDDTQSADRSGKLAEMMQAK